MANFFLFVYLIMILANISGNSLDIIKDFIINIKIGAGEMAQSTKDLLQKTQVSDP